MKKLSQPDNTNQKIVNVADPSSNQDAATKKYVDDKAATLTAASVISANGKGYVNHGSTGSTARPSGFASIEWRGTATPANATSDDTWIDTN
jgi:hypothetical protein